MTRDEERDRPTEERDMLTSDMLTSGEIQSWLGLGRTKVFDLLNTSISHGGIPNYRIGRRIIIRRQEVLAWLEQNRCRPEER